MSEICLSKQELKQLTGKVQSGAQVQALNCMGIPHRLRPDGSVVVIRAEVVSGKPESEKTTKPDFGSITDVA